MTVYYIYKNVYDKIGGTVRNKIINLTIKPGLSRHPDSYRDRTPTSATCVNRDRNPELIL